MSLVRRSSLTSWVKEVILDSEVEDEREEDPEGINLGTDEYDRGEDKAELRDKLAEFNGRVLRPSAVRRIRIVCYGEIGIIAV